MNPLLQQQLDEHPLFWFNQAGSLDADITSCSNSPSLAYRPRPKVGMTA